MFVDDRTEDRHGHDHPAATRACRQGDSSGRTGQGQAQGPRGCREHDAALPDPAHHQAHQGQAWVGERRATDRPGARAPGLQGRRQPAPPLPVDRADRPAALGAPQLLLQAFLQRIINGGGRISREYGLGRKRTDLLIEWPTDPVQGMYGPLQRIVIELKLLRGHLDTLIATGLEQTADYSSRVGADESHLIIFNRDPDILWDAKVWQRDGEHGGLTIGIWGA